MHPVNQVSRPYRPGDEAQINRLYATITGRERTPEQYAWEWLETWDGRGTMDLMFDLDRPEDDQLIAQYSLIPTPLSVFGKPSLAGKTENCMSHPDHRRTGPAAVRGAAVPLQNPGGQPEPGEPEQNRYGGSDTQLHADAG